MSDFLFVTSRLAETCYLFFYKLPNLKYFLLEFKWYFYHFFKIYQKVK